MALGELLPEYFTIEQLEDIVENAFPIDARDTGEIHIYADRVVFKGVGSPNAYQDVVYTVEVPVVS